MNGKTIAWTLFLALIGGILKRVGEAFADVYILPRLRLN